MRVKAYAKINLFLEITGKRPDGYHTLSTIFQTISLSDEITLRSQPEITLTCSDATLPVDGRNLALRAALDMHHLLKDQHNIGVQINLNKRIPTGAGLGGGSSDAAAVLSSLSTLWSRPSASALHRCAVDLGADVPFFLTGGTCLGKGIGDEIKKLSALSKTWLVLVYPGFGVSTKDAYARVRLPFENIKSVQKFIPLLKKPSKAWANQLFNRFEELIFPTHPQLRSIKEELLEAGALGALMSGSGSSIFGIVQTPGQGRKILKDMRKKYTQSWLVHTV